MSIISSAGALIKDDRFFVQTFNFKPYSMRDFHNCVQVVAHFRRLDKKTHTGWDFGLEKEQFHEFNHHRNLRWKQMRHIYTEQDGNGVCRLTGMKKVCVCVNEWGKTTTAKLTVVMEHFMIISKNSTHRNIL